MRAAPHPSQERRLETLRGYDILDTPREADFDEVVELASAICETPISVVNLIDETRQWFKAEVGLNARETPLETSLCSHVILENDFVEIPDTLADPRMADNPLCLAQDGLRFYAGALLLAPNGLPIGTLCVLDTKPRTLTDLQRTALKVLSRQVMKQLELRVALKNQTALLAEADHRVKNSLQSMSAIVRVYTRTITDDAALEALGAIQRRIDAIATLHQELQSTEGSSAIDSGAYLDRVITLLRDTAPENIHVVSQIEPIVMRSDHAANLAMIISEFVANSIKHAFPDGEGGEVSVKLSVTDLGQYRLECRDNGIGDQGEMTAPSRTTGIGINLVSAAAANLGGITNTEMTEDGSQLIVDFGDAPEPPVDFPPTTPTNATEIA